MAGSAFKDADVLKLLGNFTPVLVDGDTEKDVTGKYGVHGYPTIVFADAAGEEVDRIVGFRPVAAFGKEVGRILAGEGTLPALRKKVAESPDDVDASIALGTKLAASDAAAASALFTALAERTKDKDHATQAKVRLEFAAALLATGDREGAMREAETLVRDFADTPQAASAAARAGNAFLAADVKRALAFADAVRPLAKEPEDKAAVEKLTVAAHRNGIAASLKRQAEAAADDPMALNEIAWTCFEMKLNLRDALGWAKTAVEKSDRDPAVLDTLANLLWLTGKRDEALKTEAEASGKADPAMKREFDALIAKWKAELAAMEAARAVPATPVAPPAPKPADGDSK